MTSKLHAKAIERITPEQRRATIKKLYEMTDTTETNAPITERERNKALLQLLASLIQKDLTEEVLMVGDVIQTDTTAMKKSFYIITSSHKDPRVQELRARLDEHIRIERSAYLEELNRDKK